MKIIVNGNEKNMDEGADLIDLLTQSKLNNDKPGVAVAINDDVISTSKWKNIKLKQNDRIEIIRAVQGG
ncbi:MAG: sulfur carrier protein ThiS [Nitrospinota bacterium]|nr:sulfur carrier protein ThiS [Nitrospinota bacterium]HJN02011.1 sulfur carrier protein ThiS [Nitrospinota bacterium]